MKATLITPGLWAGSYGSLQSLDKFEELEVVVSILPIGTRPADMSASDVRGHLDHFARWKGRKLAHRVLVMSDVDALIPPEHIAHALGDNRPTLIHCNAGQNRSTAMAACWLLLHRGHHWETDGQRVLAYVSRQRQADLGNPPRVYAQMEANVSRFAEWLKAAL